MTRLRHHRAGRHGDCQDARDGSLCDAIIAARASAAVSIRKMRGPRSTSCQPLATAKATSSSVNPPSGPTASMVPAWDLRVDGFTVPSPGTDRRLVGRGLGEGWRTLEYFVLSLRHSKPSPPAPLPSCRKRHAGEGRTAERAPPLSDAQQSQLSAASLYKLIPPLRLCNLHQPIPSALLRRLDDRPPQPAPRLAPPAWQPTGRSPAARCGWCPTRPPFRPAISDDPPWAGVTPRTSGRGNSRSICSREMIVNSTSARRTLDRATNWLPLPSNSVTSCARLCAA